MKTQHTPGPWETNKLYSKVITSDGRLEICEVSVNELNEEFDYEQWRSNAQLIASAPTMLHALEEAYKELKFHNWHNTTTGMLIERTISKAKGY